MEEMERCALGMRGGRGAGQGGRSSLGQREASVGQGCKTAWFPVGCGSPLFCVSTTAWSCGCLTRSGARRLAETCPLPLLVVPKPAKLLERPVQYDQGWGVRHR